MSPLHDRRRRAPWRATVVTVLMVLAGGGLSAAGPATANPAAQVLPSPLRFVSYLDLECFRTNTYAPPQTAVVTRHLNPVLAHLPVETVVLGAREQLCVPVRKNNTQPPPDVIDFIRYVDLSCYRIQGTSINTQLSLRHLNPVLQTLPAKNVILSVPQQLCVPVVKGGLFPSGDILKLVSYIDLKCYVAQPQTSLGVGLTLGHLNPLFNHLPQHNASVTLNRQVCVPVQKNNQPIPADVLNIVRWIDLEKYDIVTPSLATPLSTTLTHINPALSHLPVEQVTVQVANQLMLPVAKNNQTPPA